MSKVEKLRVLFPKNFPRILGKMYKKHYFLAIFIKFPKPGFRHWDLSSQKNTREFYRFPTGLHVQELFRYHFVTICYHFAKCSESWKYHPGFICMYANVDGYQKFRNFLEPKQGNEKGSEDKILKKPVGNNRFFLG